MNSAIIIALSILVAIIGYRNAECDKCKYEAILFGIIFFQLRSYGFLGIKLLLIFVIGEFLIKYIDDNKRDRY